MKKFTITAVLMLMVAIPMMAERVSPETARKVATTFFNNNGAKTSQLTDISKAASFPNLYIFSAEQGFVVMAADDRVKPILGYSLTDKFNVDDMPENLRWWLQGYSDEIQWVINNGGPSDTSISEEWYDLKEGKNSKDTPVVIVAPLTNTKWAQNSPYNLYCPTGTLTGCVATAMAQVMKKWNYPAHGIGSLDYLYSNYGTLSADFGSTQYNWNAMQNSYSNDNSNEEKEAVATLMYHCGISVEMKYGPESGSNIKRASVSLKTYFNYNATYYEKKNFNNDDWIAMLKENLNDGVPVLYGGSNSSNEGHAFVCDGYDNRDYFHFNWGWGGSPDAYYSINGHLYPNKQCAVFNIVPSTCSASIPENLTCTQQSGYQVTLSWDGANNAISYNIYRNNILLANTTDCSFTDTHAEIGINSYYVRSVDSENHLSLSSNCINLTINRQDPVVENLSVSFSDSNALLSWDAPIWYPQTNPDVLSNVDESRPDLDNYISWDTRFCWYWGVRYLANDIQNFQDKAIYMVKIYNAFPASYQVFIYQGTNEEDGPRPVELLATQSSSVAKTGWIEIRLDEPVIIDSSKDLWVFVYNPDSEVKYTPCKDVDYQGYGNYYSYDLASERVLPHECCYSLTDKIEWNICTYLTDDIYTYQLECNNTQIAQSISSTSYEDKGLANDAIYQYTVKTNHHGGVSTASNMAGLAVGTTSVNGTLSLASNDRMTITESSRLTVTGTLTNTNSDNLVLENGAQLINDSDNVQATIKKSIAKYTSDQNGWNFIASPVTESITPDESNGLLANNYDLFYFDQNEEAEWKNHKNHDFTLDHKKGYLYANSDNTTLTFAGTLAATVNPTDLKYNADAEFAGFNLVGNPYPCNATVNKDFYEINGNAIVMLASTAREIVPCEGIFVKATSADDPVTFTKVTIPAKSAISKNCIDLIVTQGKDIIDRARVRLGEGIGMEKFCLDDNHSQISLWQNGQDFAVAYANHQEEMPVSFKPVQNCTYTLNIENEAIELNYLHLIDNLTGHDVDLLSTPDYTFEAKTTDYASRFRLLLAPICEDANIDNETFAYLNNGNIIVNDEDATMLQIVDMMGRVIVSHDGHIQCVPTSGMTAGVYVVRLINGDNVKTQKIVIE